MNPPPSRLDGFQKLALATTLSTYALILIGALVRAAGAGLGCPDWPRCFGRWIPPLSASQLPPGYDPAGFSAFRTWLEYGNRLVGVAIGLLILLTLLAAWRRHRGRKRIVGPTLAAALLVGYQGWLGGQVVRSGLQPWMVTAHLVVALIIVSLLLYATFHAFRPAGADAQPSPAHRITGRLSWVVLVLTLGQIGLGTQVRAGIEHALRELGELPRALWLAQVPQLDHLHRTAAIVVVVGVLVLRFRVRRVHGDDLWLLRATRLVLALAGLQLAAGLALSYLEMPATAQVLHLSFASLLLGALTWVALLCQRSPTH